MVAYFEWVKTCPTWVITIHRKFWLWIYKTIQRKTAELIDEEKRIVAQEYERAKQILIENAAGHNALAEYWLNVKLFSQKILKKIFGKRQWTSRQDELMAQNGGADILDETPKLGAASTAENQPAEEKTEEGQKRLLQQNCNAHYVRSIKNWNIK